VSLAEQLRGRGSQVMAPGLIHLVIVSETPIHREGLAMRMAREPGVQVVGSSDSIRDTVSVARDGKADVILLDVPPTWDNQVDLTAAVRALPDMYFVTMAEVDSDTEVVAWAEAGADGIVDRRGPPVELKAVLETVIRGELDCSPRVAAALLRRVQALAQERRPNTAATRLTQRETDVLLLVGRGLTNKQISRELGLQLPTVKNHIHTIFEKLRVHTRTEAAALAVALREHRTWTDLGARTDGRHS
jgi:two-component system, NarL family, nitrate/nitrite response regulator NarL